MSSTRYVHLLDGQELAEEDLNLFASEAAHADDYVFAELLKLAPFNGTTTSKAVLPFYSQNSQGSNGSPNSSPPLISPGTSGSIPLVIQPFRAIIGSRIQPTGSPPTPLDPVITTASELSYRDIRSAVFVPSNGNTFGYQIPATAFASGSGQNRWDLVYATVFVDQNNGLSRFTKPPNATQGSIAAANSDVTTTVGTGAPAYTNAIRVLQGTPSASPLFPSVPADIPGTGEYHIPLAYVLVPTTFIQGTSFFTAPYIYTVAPCVSVMERLGSTSVCPATITVAQQAAMGIAWGSTQIRPSYVLQTTMRGSVETFFGMDFRSIASGTIVDSSCDWRNRIFWTMASHVPSGSATTYFPWQHGISAASGAIAPLAAGGTSSSANNVFVTSGQSFLDDSTVFGNVSGTSAILAWVHNSSALTGNQGGSGIAGGFQPLAASQSLYIVVDQSSGFLKIYYGGPSFDLDMKVFFWIRATAQYDNP